MACCHGTVEPPASEVSIAFAQTVASFIILEGLEQVEEQTPALPPVRRSCEHCKVMLRVWGVCDSFIPGRFTID